MNADSPRRWPRPRYVAAIDLEETEGTRWEESWYLADNRRRLAAATGQRDDNNIKRTEAEEWEWRGERDTAMRKEHWLTIGTTQAIGAAPDAVRMQRVVNFYEKLPRGPAPQVKATGLLGRYQARYFAGKNASATRMLGHFRGGWGVCC